MYFRYMLLIFVYNKRETTEIYTYGHTLSLHDALPISTSLGNWTCLVRACEKIRLRCIKGSAISYFDVRIPGLKMTVVAADGQYVHPVSVDEFRIAVAE